MTTIGEVNVKVSADLSGLIKAQGDAKKYMGDLDKSLEASAKNVDKVFGSSWQSGVVQFSNGAQQANSAAKQMGEQFKKTSSDANIFNGYIKNAGRASLQAGMQFNDLFVQLASGQSAFTAITQQGAQLVQMFEPGTGIGAAAKSLGSSFVSFLINPLNLSLVAIAGVAAALPMIWDVFTGADAKASEEVLKNFNNLIEEIGKKSTETGEKIKTMLDQPRSWSALLADASRQSAEQQKYMSQNIDEAISKMNSFITKWQDITPATLSAQQKIRDLGQELKNNEDNASAVYEELNNLRNAETTPPSLFDTIDTLRELIRVALEAKGKLDALGGVLKSGRIAGIAEAQDMASRFSDVSNTQERFAGDVAEGWKNKLSEALGSQAEKLGEKSAQNAMNEMGVSDIPTPTTRPTFELGYSGMPSSKKKGGGRSKTAKGESFVEQLQIETDFLQKQLDLMGLSYDERERQLQQLETEKKVKEAIARLGEKATPAQIEQIKKLIPLQQQLNNEIATQKAIQDTLNNAYEDAAQGIGAAISGAITGADDLGKAFANVALKIAEAVIQAQLLSAFSDGKGGLTQGGGIISSLVKGIFGGISFDGGGYTGDGSRSGGLDGKGGFLAMVHPNETVIDHTKGVAVPRAMARPSVGGSMGPQSIVITLDSKTDSSVIQQIADTRIQGAAPTIVKTSVQKSQQLTKQNMGNYLTDTQMRKM